MQKRNVDVADTTHGKYIKESRYRVAGGKAVNNKYMRTIPLGNGEAMGVLWGVGMLFDTD
ncbi:hypothetical protein PHLCEN_2v5286 [Hermanssonia centrifuga]|uniref:Uncharacterized protein n=1 Tax=Hermanssonia centrifuga TaxID=98765 RepID=A0A2R6P8I3_9APHY|nr:hypothetical protein PHLCEN_2v5286 [Hermanssonia centrifuga]